MHGKAFYNTIITLIVLHIFILVAVGVATVRLFNHAVFCAAYTLYCASLCLGAGWLVYWVSFKSLTGSPLHAYY